MLDYVLLEALRNHHKTTYEHSIRVAILCYQIGMMSGFTKDECFDLFRSGLFHDIGKLLIPRSLLSLDRNLTENEYSYIKTHVVKGVELLRQFNEKTNVLTAIEGHHEREDGSGYPNGGLSHTDYSKVLAVCDVFDAVSEDREYRTAIPKSKVIQMMKHGKLGALSSKYVSALQKLTIVQNNNLEILASYQSSIQLNVSEVNVPYKI